MKKSYLFLSLFLIGLNLHAQLRVSGKTKLPDGTPFQIFKIINDEPLALVESQSKDGKIELEIKNFIEYEPLVLVVYANNRIFDTEFISENADLEYDEKKFLIRGGIENQLRYNFIVNSTSDLIKIQSNIYNKLYKLEKLNSKIEYDQNEFYEWYPKMKIVSSELNNYIKQLKEFIKNNPKAYFSYFATENLFKMNLLNIEEIIEFNNLLKNNFQYKPLIEEFKKRIDVNEHLLIGESIPNHTLIDSNEKEIDLYNNLGKVTLIDFWSTNCKPCRAENKNLIEIFKKYKKKNFKIIRINTDANNDLLKKLVEKEQTEWINISKVHQKNFDIDSIYKVKVTPVSFLVDEKGKIIAKDLVDEELSNKINELLKK